MNGLRGLVAAAMVAAVSVACTPSATQRSCDRECFIGLADRYLEALAVRDPASAPLSDGVAFVENVNAIRPGEGLWASAAGAATGFRIYVPDPPQNAIGLMTVIDRQTERGIVPATVIRAVRDINPAAGTTDYFEVPKVGKAKNGRLPAVNFVERPAATTSVGAFSSLSSPLSWMNDGTGRK